MGQLYIHIGNIGLLTLIAWDQKNILKRGPNAECMNCLQVLMHQTTPASQRKTPLAVCSRCQTKSVAFYKSQFPKPPSPYSLVVLHAFYTGAMWRKKSPKFTIQKFFIIFLFCFFRFFCNVHLFTALETLVNRESKFKWLIHKWDPDSVVKNAPQ